MDQHLNWSLVLLVFILASQVTDVLSRHHHIKLRHERHRRQHGESYLPASFVSDTDEEESGTWGPWSSPSSCSRSCGGGVADQSRVCHDLDPSTGNTLCTGPKKRFFSCNVQDCPEPAKDFRAEQCAEFNSVPVEGIYYDWIPYTGGPNKCELNCMPRGERFFYRHKLSVTDGTPCTTEQNDVCVQGKCRHVGCDMMLGSDAKEDRCRECGGDGSACNTVQGLLDMNDLQVGYNDILLIPAGATNIAISEVRPSNNYLAIRNTTGHYYLNGNWRIDFPRSLRFAGSVFHYERRPKEIAAADIISALGPTTEAIYITLLYQDTNVGVTYEYSIPKRFSQQSKPDSYTWVIEDFSECSVTCGGGIQSRLVRCVRRRDNEEADESLCDRQFEPTGTQACGEEPCPPEWVIGEWGTCSKSCGSGGEQSREIECKQIISGNIRSTVDDSQCLEAVGPKDIETQECNKGVECPQWHIGPWKPCNRLCGAGNETRKITCYTKVNGKISVMDDSACLEDRPKSEKECKLRPCAGVDWVVSKWSGCDYNCGLTHETRTTTCMTLDGEIYPDDQCNAETKPKLVRECSSEEKCTFQWYATQWSECSAKCGHGIQTRKVFCGTSPPGSDSIKEVEAEKCDAAKKYNATQDCEGEVKECRGEWFAGPWSECSKPCGGGDRIRKVICMKDNQVVSQKGNCDEEDFMLTSETCNDKSCEPDGNIYGPGTPSVLTDEDGEECEEEEGDEFRIIHSDLDGSEFQNDDTFLRNLDEIMMGDGPLTGIGSGFGTDNIDDEDQSEGSGSSTIYTSTSDTTSTDSTATFDTDTTDYTSPTESTFTGPTELTTLSDTQATGKSTKTEVSPIPLAKGASESKKQEIGLEQPYPPNIPDLTTKMTTVSTSLSGSPSTKDTGETIESTTASGDTTDTTVSGADETTFSGSDTTIPSSTQGVEAASSDTSTLSTPFDSTIVTESEPTAGPESTDDTSESSQPSDATSDVYTDLTSSGTPSSVETSSTDSDATKSTSPDTTESSDTDTAGTISSETTVSPSSGTTESPGPEASESSSSDTTVLSNTETTGSTSSDTTLLISSETEEASSTDASASSSLDTTVWSSSSTTESSGEDTAVSASLDTTISPGTETSESPSTETTTSGSSPLSSETTESSPSPDTTESESTGITGSEETTESGATTITGEAETTESDTTGETTETGITGDTTESGITETYETDDTTQQSHMTDRWSTVTNAITTEGKRQCKKIKTKKSCKKSTFGCCYDGITAAKGPFGKGCLIPETCNKTKFGCCPDEVSPATGPNGKGCPDSHCSETLFGCCEDNATPAEGNDFEGCPVPCNKTEFDCCPDGKTPAAGKNNLGCCNTTTHGCCPDGIKPASGPDGEGCIIEESSTIPYSSTVSYSASTGSEGDTEGTTPTSSTDTTESTTVEEEGYGCEITEFGCCPNGVLAATGPRNEGCRMACDNSTFGCCDDGSTPAHGPNKEGCCLTSTHKCCPDNIRKALGPDFYGCGCQYARYRCCPDNTTTARGPNNEGCGCEHSPHGCCPNQITAASGPDFEGCPCHAYQFGCCPDGVSIAKGPQNQGCGCESTEFKCCSDGRTPAKGENYAGCTCDASKYGCCPDGVEEAQGENFEGCLTVPLTPGASCALEKDRGPCLEFSVRWFFDTEYGGCSRFWYGGCDGNDNRFKSQEECKDVCVEPKGRDACFLPKIAGPCEGYHPTWYYDTERKQCGQFIHSGCLGNANKFKTREDCEELCVEPDDVDPCEQAKEVGPCGGNFTRWYFSKETDSCEEFTYGGCKANKNNFATQISCQQQCLPAGRSRVQDVCALEKEPGPCPGSLLRWYYDAKRESCRQFVFGGCKGNGNKFRTYAACEQRCPVRDSCSLPRKEGTCTEKHARWFFDQTEHHCMPFYYTGCGGNRNNYGTREACDSECPPKIEKDTCLLPAILGNCDNYTERWYYDTYDQRCRQFYYGGCGGNENNFQTEQDCTQRCEPSKAIPAPVPPQFRTEFCFLPEDFGPCDGDSVKWFYDSVEGVCKQFRYGGCGGNGNNFNTHEECEHRCGNVQDPCELPQVVGSCRAAFRKFYYESRSDSCIEFIYGGCEGNKNNFEDKKSCEERCKRIPDITPTTTTTTIAPTIQGVPDIPHESPICSAPRDPGPCNNNETAYYYNAENKICEAFIYGGCEGNGNRFQTEEQCERLCGSFQGQDVCNIQADPGPCRAALTKFYFDPISRRCQEFTYGGCDGNANRFSSEDECESICMHREEPTPSGQPPDTAPTLNEIDVGPPGPKPKDPCQIARAECNAIHCEFGKEEFVDDRDCTRCRCVDPCSIKNCPEGTKCAVDIVPRGNSFEHESVCRPLLKPGNCPRVSNSTTCQRECSSDADCTGDSKCCSIGCGSSCLEPAPTELITTPVTSYDTVPYPGAVPAFIERPAEPNLRAQEGGYIIMTCVVTGNPRPVITWRKGVTLIDNSVSRYSISGEGSLEIIGLYRTDAGTYTCTADNRLAAPVRTQYELEITAPREHGPAIVGKPNYRVTVSLNSPAVLRCQTWGWPRPSVSWWHGTDMLKLDDGVYQYQRDNSLKIHRVSLVNLGNYTCQAFNGVSKAASWSVTLQAPGPVYDVKPEHQKYLRYLVEPQRRPSPTPVRPPPPYRPQTIPPPAPEPPTYAPYYPEAKPYVPPVVSVTDPSPEIVVHKYTAPVKVNVSVDSGPFPVGSEFSIACDVEGFPIPQVVWYKDDIPIQPDNRIRISEVNRLTISNAAKSDTGRYRCEAGNQYTRDEKSVDVTVDGLYIHADCQDNPFFAKCSLIVKGKFCPHEYYAKFCCRSCTEAGQLPVRQPHINETRRKRRSIFTSL